MIIDSHQHFWNYNQVEYGWISEDKKMLMRDFLPVDLKYLLIDADIDGVVSVQARQSIEETNWLLQMAEENDFIKGVVGWLPIADTEFKSYLESYANRDKLSSLRHIIQDEPDPDFILKKEFNSGIAELKNFGLAYDILIYENQLPNTIAFVDQHPSQVFILDHIAKPKIGENLLSPWRENIRELAKRENVYCKISGMITEADFKGWTKEQLVPYFEICLDAFGADRLMFGSDWPVCLIAVSYKEWLNIVKEFIAKISVDEQTQILYKNVLRAYNLELF
jgi:L-fuconolactonase